MIEEKRYIITKCPKCSYENSRKKGNKNIFSCVWCGFNYNLRRIETALKEYSIMEDFDITEMDIDLCIENWYLIYNTSYEEDFDNFIVWCIDNWKFS